MPEVDARPTLLVVRDSGLGDLLTALPALRALRRALPDHRLVTTAPWVLLPLLEWLDVADEALTEPAAVTTADPQYHPAIDRALLDHTPWAAHRPETVVVLRVPDEPALFADLIACNPKQIVGYRCKELRATWDWPVFEFDEHILQRWSRLLASAGIVTDDRDIDIRGHLAARELPLPVGPGACSVIHLGAAGRARIWPTDRWAQVARELTRAGHHVVLTGGPADTAAGAAVREYAGLADEQDLTGRTSILDLVGIVAKARLILSTDTGPSHLATAFARPAVTLFGAVPPRWWGPPPGTEHQVCLWHGGYGDPYGNEVDPGLLSIHPNEVLAAAAQALEPERRRFCDGIEPAS